jgi:capsular exopolysaccharide synthesis family protein
MTTAAPTRPAPPHAGPRPRRPAPAAARTIDPFRLLRRHVLLLGATGVAGVFLGVVLYILLNMFSPRYTGEVLFEMRAGLNEARSIGAQDIAHEDLVNRLASTEVALLMSRDVLDAAVKRGEVKATSWFQRHFVDLQGTDMIDDAVDDLEKDLQRRMIQGTNLFGVRWATAVAADVPIVLNAIKDAYLEERRRQDTRIYNDNLTLFQDELRNTERELSDRKAEIGRFIREKDITTLDDPRSNQLAMAVQDILKRLNEVKALLTTAQSLHAQTSGKLEGTVEPSDDDLLEARSNPAVQPHEVAMMGAETALRETREKYRDPADFNIRTAEGRLRAMETQYKAKLREIVTDNLRARLKAAADQIERSNTMIEELEKDYQEKKTTINTLAADMAAYQQLEEELAHLSAARDADLELIKQVRLMRLRADAARVREAQRARKPREKSFPQIEYVVPASTVILVGLVTGLIFLREITDQRVKSAADLFVVPEARVLGVIPELSEDPCRCEAAELVVRRSPQSVLAESYRQTWALVDKAMGRLGHQTMLVVGGLPDSGGTTVITNLAAAAAGSGRSVVVVDANFRRPRLGEVLGVGNDEPGLGDVLLGKLEPEQAARETDRGIHVVTAGTPANRVFERLNNGQFDRLIAELRSRFDLVLVDAPPAVVAGDALALAGKLDAAVMVVRAYQEQRGLVARLLNQLVDAHCEVLGIVLNRPRGTAGGYFKKNFAEMARYGATPSAKA